VSEREDSYYEIALTHRQVMWVFIVLLGCVAAAFFAGLWLGREPASEAPLVVHAEEEPTVEEPAEDLESLRFFSEDEAAPRKAVEPPTEETTLAEDLGAAAPVEEPPLATPPPAAAPVEEAPQSAVRAEAGSPEGAPTTREGLVIQVFSSADRTQAQQLVDRLQEGGHPAFLSPEEVGGRTMFRVRIGPYEERQSAERVAENVRRSYRLDTWITQNS
jgi:cell division septation protein DedD